MQQVNFFHSRFRPQRDLFSARYCVIYLLLLVTGLLLSSMVIKQHQALKQAELLQLEKLDDNLVMDQHQLNSIKVCQKELSDFFLLEAWQGEFRVAPLLEQFTEVDRPGIWLTGVEISQAGEKIMIHGAAKTQDLEPISRFVRQLSQQKTFTSYHVHSLQLNREQRVVSNVVTGYNASTVNQGWSHGLQSAGRAGVHFRVNMDKNRDTDQVSGSSKSSTEIF